MQYTSWWLLIKRHLTSMQRSIKLEELLSNLILVITWGEIENQWWSSLDDEWLTTSYRFYVSLGSWCAGVGCDMTIANMWASSSLGAMDHAVMTSKQQALRRCIMWWWTTSGGMTPRDPRSLDGIMGDPCGSSNRNLSCVYNNRSSSSQLS